MFPKKRIVDGRNTAPVDNGIITGNTGYINPLPNCGFGFRDHPQYLRSLHYGLNTVSHLLTSHHYKSLFITVDGC